MHFESQACKLPHPQLLMGATASDKVVKVPWMRSNFCKLKIYREDFGYNFEGELSGYATVMFFFLP